MQHLQVKAVTKFSEKNCFSAIAQKCKHLSRINAIFDPFLAAIYFEKL